VAVDRKTGDNKKKHQKRYCPKCESNPRFQKACCPIPS